MGTHKLMVVGTGSNVGKTTITLGLMAAYKKLNYNVQGFKCGPDYIDPTYQTVITGRQSRNLDSWMCEEAFVKEVFSDGCQDADIAIIEGVMGMFDGKDPLSNVGSSAEIAAITNTPLLLVIDASGIARSAAAIVKGFQTLSPDVTICGVVANRVGSKGHFELIKQAVEQECDVPVIGFLERDDQLTLPERYAGLVPLLRNEHEPAFQFLAEKIIENFDLDKLYQLMGKEKASNEKDKIFGISKQKSEVKIAVAKDESFCFYYEDNLRLLEQSGAELKYFSPLKGEIIEDDIDGLYIGGGFPERYAEELASQKTVLSSLYEKIQDGLPTLAEGGGFMYMTDAIADENGNEHEMVGIIPGKTNMHSRLVALGYRTIVGMNDNYLFPANKTARGHVFHYSSFEPTGELEAAYEVEGRRGKNLDGYLYKNLIASYTHIHFGSAPNLPRKFIDQCIRYKNGEF